MMASHISPVSIHILLITSVAVINPHKMYVSIIYMTEDFLNILTTFTHQSISYLYHIALSQTYNHVFSIINKHRYACTYVHLNKTQTHEHISYRSSHLISTHRYFDNT